MYTYVIIIYYLLATLAFQISNLKKPNLSNCSTNIFTRIFLNRTYFSACGATSDDVFLGGPEEELEADSEESSAFKLHNNNSVIIYS